MVQKIAKRRFITLELNPAMSDKDEHNFKEAIAQGLKDLRHANDKAALFFPRKVLRTNFEKASDIVVHNKIISLK